MFLCYREFASWQFTSWREENKIVQIIGIICQLFFRIKKRRDTGKLRNQSWNNCWNSRICSKKGNPVTKLLFQLKKCQAQRSPESDSPLKLISTDWERNFLIRLWNSIRALEKSFWRLAFTSGQWPCSASFLSFITPLSGRHTKWFH